METRQNNFYDATRDVTEKDLAMRRYYSLMDAQAWRDMERRIRENKKDQETVAKFYALIALFSLAAIGAAIATVINIFN